MENSTIINFYIFMWTQELSGWGFPLLGNGFNVYVKTIKFTEKLVWTWVFDKLEYLACDPGFLTRCAWLFSTPVVMRYLTPNFMHCTAKMWVVSSTRMYDFNASLRQSNYVMQNSLILNTLVQCPKSV